MKRILFPLVIAAAMIFTSCATSKFYSQNASSVHPVAMVQPFTYLTDAVADFPIDYVKLFLSNITMPTKRMLLSAGCVIWPISVRALPVS